MVRAHSTTELKIACRSFFHLLKVCPPKPGKHHSPTVCLCWVGGEPVDSGNGLGWKGS